MEYVHVIVPLKLDWEPVYRVPAGMPVHPGDRVRVRLAGREYVGVVHSGAAAPDLPESRIRPLLENCSEAEGRNPAPGAAGVPLLPAVTPGELNLWEFVSDYYMCSIGEVYKAAYPAARVKVETSKSRRAAAPPAPTSPRCKRQADVELCRQIYDGFADGRPVLLTTPQRVGTLSTGNCPASRRIAFLLARRALQEGRGVLIMTPEAEAAAEGFVAYNSSTSPAARRDLAARLREGSPCAVLGTRMSVFLPFSNLGLIIVLDEHSTAYKQSEPAPRYNARDLAVKLASVHGADVLLCSGTPSLESLYNCDTGKYRLVQGGADPVGDEFTAAEVPNPPEVGLIDTTAERRKNGMTGCLSRKLVAELRECLERKQRVALLLPWKNTDDVEIEARGVFPEARTRLAVISLAGSRRPDVGKYSLVALLSAEYLLKGEDFRADEKALRQLIGLRCSVRGRLVIQTSDAGHPVFRAALTDDAVATLREMAPMRARFNLPPYTRIVDVVFRDDNDARRGKMMRALSARLPVSGMTADTLRIILPKDRNVRQTKRDIFRTVTAFAEEMNYGRFIHFDTDPS